MRHDKDREEDVHAKPEELEIGARHAEGVKRG